MSVQGSVKRFFIDRIVSNLMKKVSDEESKFSPDLQQLALEMYLDSSGLSNDFKEYQKLLVEYKEAGKNLNDKKELLAKKVKELSGENVLYYTDEGVIKYIYERASKELLTKLQKEHHPEAFERISTLKRMMDEVEAVVLLATTETKLRDSLLALLTKYGEDVSELQEMLDLTK